VKADPGQLEQVLLNLVVNARDAMPRGGRIVVETSEALVTSAEAQAHVGARAGPHVVLSVSDEGIGIPPELLPRIFEPFFTTKEEGKGTGLGLATVFGIVAQAGGHIRVSSEPGKGTRFVVYLPRASESPSRRMSTSVLKVPGGSETVLVVDDQDAVRTLATRVLQFNGYVVLAAGSAEEALELAAKSERVDLLLTDALMPGLSGPELAHRLREKRPGIRVLLMSGYADPKVVSAGQQEGSAFLAKPFTARELADRVRRVLDEEPAGG
jgi:CheY-like chemotaxis protein